MKGYKVYRQIWDKAEEVRGALSALWAVRGQKDPHWSSNDLIDFFSRDGGLSAVEADIKKDTRRHVGVLYRDYCGLRDELIALLTAETTTSKSCIAVADGPT